MDWYQRGKFVVDRTFESGDPHIPAFLFSLYGFREVELNRKNGGLSRDERFL
jgi:hypothetical protein